LHPQTRDSAAHDTAPYAQVVVDAPTTVPSDTFTYSAPPELRLRPGHLVRVPFGPRIIHGLVVRLIQKANVDYTKPVSGLVHSQPLVTPAQLELARWVSTYYRAPLFDAVAAMLPPGFRARTQQSIALREGVLTPSHLPPGATRLLAHLRSYGRPLQVRTLARTLGPWVPNAVRALVEAGLVNEETQAPAPRAGQADVNVLRPALGPVELAAFAREATRSPRQAALAASLVGHGAPMTAAEARAEFGASAVAALVTKGLARIAAEPRAAYEQRQVGPPVPPLLPTGPQVDALAAIRAALDDASKAPRTWLLEGVTGSGKTEVYLQAIAHCIGLAKRAIVLVPELALTPQTMARFTARFPGRVAELHSGLTHSRHWREWWAAHGGEVDIVVGSRSAVFAPLPDIGLVILDEEHEWTYKQIDASPRYHARDVAIHRAWIEGAVVVLGSATPDLATGHAARTGAYGHLRLPERIERSGATADRADVYVVDMRQELKNGNRSVFSRRLQEGLQRCAAAGEQALLFLNRRGGGGIVACRNCGHVMRCWSCTTPYTFHGGTASNTGGTLVCHHCNRRRRMPQHCPNCRSDRIRYLGLGTQRLVDEVHALLPNARVLRWDRDSASTAAAHAELLRHFESGEANVLIGTQMIAKGLDIPSVTLVGVVLADLALYVPDFRAPERTFQLLTQVAGRAGRGATPGEAVIQTYDPSHYAVQAAAMQDYDAFYEQEMRHRIAHGNPPARRLARLMLGHSQEEGARHEAQRLASLLRHAIREWDMPRVEIVGPVPAYPPRLRGAWRWHLVIRAPDPAALLDKISIPPAWAVDIDPAQVS